MSQRAKLPIAVQLYSLRELPGDFADMLGKVSAAGYGAVELIGDHGCTIDEMRDLLQKNKLTVSSAHVQLDALQDNTDEIITFQKGIGNNTLIVPFIPHLVKQTNASVYRETGALLGELSRRCKDKGVRLLYHDHHWEMMELDGKLAIDWLFEAAGPDLGFEPDLGWIIFGGVDPVVLMQRYSGRCSIVHVKDLAQKGVDEDRVVMDGAVMADVGHGTIDWPPLLTAAKQAGAEWYVVEHDNPRDPIASITRSYEYLSNVLPGVLAG